MADRSGPVATVRSPATSANLGPGFDAFGLCLGLYDEVSAWVTSSGLTMQVSGEGVDDVPRNEEHLVVRSMRAAFDRLAVAQPPGLALTCRNRIAHGRGLGSSAAAIVAGVQLASALAPDVSLSPGESLAVAAELEGHPDNVAACLLGGLTIAWTGEDGGASAVALPVHRDVRPVVFLPAAALSTEAARALLPGSVPHDVAAENAGRAGLLVAALTLRPELLLPATDDLLHQDYRRPAMPESLALVDALRDADVAAAISGAGPAVLALGTQERPIDVRRWTPPRWECLTLEIDGVGATTTVT